MPPYCKTSPYEFERFIQGKGYEGIRFFSTRELCKAVAREVRKRFNIPARTIVVPASSTDGGYIGGYLERYLLMLSTDELLPDGTEEFINSVKDYG